MNFEFEEKLKKEYIHKNSQGFCGISGKKLTVSLAHKQNVTSFHKVVYTHKMQSKSKYEFHIAVVECEAAFLQSLQTIYEVNVNKKNVVMNKAEERIIFGDISNEPEEVFIEEDAQIINWQGGSFEVSESSPAWNDDSLSFSVQIETSLIPILIREQVAKDCPSIRRKGMEIKREHQESF